MNALVSVVGSMIDEHLGRAVGWALLHSLWQGVIAVLLLALALRVLDRKAARLRYGLACVALMLMSVAPVATGVIIYRETVTAPSAPTLRLQRVPSLLQDDRVGEAPPAAGQTFLPPALQSPPGLRWIALGWMLGVCVSTLRLLADTAGLHRLARGATPAPVRWQGTVDRLARVLQMPRTVRLLESSKVAVPCAIGWVRPMILLPVTAISGLAPAELEMILAHELAHLRRHDFAVNVAQRVVETVFFYHPGVRWASKVIRAERENCCDDDAVQACGSPVAYARALTELEALRVEPRTSFARRGAQGRSAALSALGGSLGSRVRRLITPRANPSPRRVAGASLLTFASAVALAGSVSVASIAHAAHGEPASATQTATPDAGGAPVATSRSSPSVSAQPKAKPAKRNGLLPRKSTSSRSQTWTPAPDDTDLLQVQHPTMTAPIRRPTPPPPPDVASAPVAPPPGEDVQAPQPPGGVRVPDAPAPTARVQAPQPPTAARAPMAPLPPAPSDVARAPLPPNRAAAPVAPPVPSSVMPPPLPPTPSAVFADPAPEADFDVEVPEIPDLPKAFEPDSDDWKGVLSDAQRAQIREQVRQAREAARAAARDAREQVRAAQEELREQTREQLRAMRDQLRERDRQMRERLRQRDGQLRERDGQTADHDSQAREQAEQERAQAEAARDRAEALREQAQARAERLQEEAEQRREQQAEREEALRDQREQEQAQREETQDDSDDDEGSNRSGWTAELHVDPGYAEAMNRAFGRTLSGSELFGLQSVGVSPEYVGAMNQSGLGTLSVRDLEQARTVGVEPDYVRSLKAAGAPLESIRDLVRLRAMGVEASFVEGLRRAGVNPLTSRDLAQLRALDVDGAYVQSMREAGLTDLSPRNLERLRARGVTPSELRSEQPKR